VACPCLRDLSGRIGYEKTGIPRTPACPDGLLIAYRPVTPPNIRQIDSRIDHDPYPGDPNAGKTLAAHPLKCTTCGFYTEYTEL
jgi:hypothetical protein